MLIAYTHCVLAKYHYHLHCLHLLALSRVAAQEGMDAARSLTTILLRWTSCAKERRLWPPRLGSAKASADVSTPRTRLSGKVKDILDSRPIPVLVQLTSTSMATTAGADPVEAQDDEGIEQGLRADADEQAYPPKKQKLISDDGEQGSPKKKHRIGGYGSLRCD